MVTGNFNHEEDVVNIAWDREEIEREAFVIIFIGAVNFIARMIHTAGFVAAGSVLAGDDVDEPAILIINRITKIKIDRFGFVCVGIPVQATIHTAAIAIA